MSRPHPPSLGRPATGPTTPAAIGRRAVLGTILAASAGVSSGDATPPPPPVGRSVALATPTLNFPGSDDASGNTSGEGWAVSYDAIPVFAGCEGLQAAFVNAHMSGAGSEGADGVPATYAVAYEYPFGSGVMHPASWGGADHVTVASGALSAFHDPLDVPGLSDAPSGALLGVQTVWIGSDDAYVNAYSHRRSPQGAKLTGRNAAGAPPSAATVDRTGWNAAGDLLMPVLIKASRPAAGPAEVYVGDSITVDQAHTADGWGVAGFAREADAARGVLKLCATGDSLAAQPAHFDIRALVIAAIPESRINVHVNLGVNDLPAADAPTLLSDLQALIGRLKAIGPAVHVYPMTISPRFDNGAAVGAAVRAAYNAGIRSGVAGADGWYDFGAWAEAPNAPDSGSWGAVAGVSKEGGDGTHPRWFDASVASDLLAARRAWRTAQGL